MWSRAGRLRRLPVSWAPPGAATSGAVAFGLSGAAVGTAGGLVTGAAMKAAEGGNAGQIAMAGLAGAGRGLFYGGISGVVAGAALPLAAAGGSGWLGGGMAMSGSLALGDWPHNTRLWQSGCKTGTIHLKRFLQG